MQKKLLQLFSGILCVQIAAAQNLVPNGDFESYSALPNFYSQSNFATAWNNVNGNYSGPPYGSPDYYHTSGTVGTFFGPITPFSGNGQMGFATYSSSLPNFRECIATSLSSPMVTGQQYQVSFYLSNGFNNNYPVKTNNIGIRFSVSPLFQAVDQPIAAIPQIEITAIVTNVNVWQGYTYSFTADSAYNHMTIGNFRSDAGTLKSGVGIGAYYFIDMISVMPVTPLPVGFLNFTGYNDGDKNKLNWVTASEINNDYFTVERSADNFRWVEITTIDGAGNSVKPLQYHANDYSPPPGICYYRIKQTDFNGNFSFSEVIRIEVLERNNLFAAYPNPAHHQLTVYAANATAAEVLLTVKDISGKTLDLQSIKTNNGTFTHVLSLHGFPNGVYILEVQYPGRTEQLKFIKQ